MSFDMTLVQMELNIAKLKKTEAGAGSGKSCQQAEQPEERGSH